MLSGTVLVRRYSKMLLTNAQASPIHGAGSSQKVCDQAEMRGLPRGARVRRNTETDRYVLACTSTMAF